MPHYNAEASLSIYLSFSRFISMHRPTSGASRLIIQRTAHDWYWRSVVAGARPGGEEARS